MAACNTKLVIFCCFFDFGVYFTDRPEAGLKKYIEKRHIMKAVHNTFQAVSWQDVHTMGTYRYQNSRRLLTALPLSDLSNAA